MPKNEEEMNRVIKNKIDDSINSVSRNTYMSPPEVSKSYEDLMKNMDNSVDKLISRSKNKTGNNMSQVYSRWHKTGDPLSTDLGDQIQDIFGNQELMDGLMSMYMENKYIKDFDDEINIICRYMPLLLEALEVKRDAVLSADVFNKEFMSINNISVDDEDEEGKLAADIKELERVYKIEEMIDTSYMNGSKYGEQFIYIISYKDAFNSLLQALQGDFNDTNINTAALIKEDVININESCVTIGDSIVSFKDKDEENNINIDDLSMNINLSNGGLTNLVLQNEGFRNYAKDNDHKEVINYISETYNFYDDNIAYKDKMNTNNYRFTPDGLYNNSNGDKEDINVLGCVVRRLKRESVIPIYIDDVCMGFYYVENTSDNIFDMIQNANDPMVSFTNKNGSFNMEDLHKEEMLKRMAELISSNINKKFINNNPDISNELYTILKYHYVHGDRYGNGTDIKITFIPPDNMIHFYFEKDPDTHRGISDLYKSLFPAKLYAALYITNGLGVLTRGQDKRAYYVRQHVDTNIAKLLMGTINQIRKSNFGVRDINNLNNLFNIVGRFNDYVIPESASGERPINFEIIPGQDIQDNQDLLDRLEGMAINPLGVPLELLDTRSGSIEFARQITTSNGKFARSVLKRQRTTKDFIGDLITRIYNYHFDTNVELECVLSPPSYLTISNTNELIANANDMTNSIIEIDVPSDQQNEEWVSHYKRELMKFYLSSYIDWDEMGQMKRRAKLEAEANKKDNDY